MKNSHLFEAILKEEVDSNNFEEEDIGGYLGNVRGLRRDIYDGAYDSRISDIGNMDDDVPNESRVEDVVESIMQEWTGGDEDTTMAVHDSLEDAVLDRWYSIYN